MPKDIIQFGITATAKNSTFNPVSAPIGEDEKVQRVGYRPMRISADIVSKNIGQSLGCHMDPHVDIVVPHSSG